jgi:CRISPR-associated endonuclease Csy4
MLTHYFELRAIPQLELSEVEVMNQLMQSLHHCLAKLQGQIGICFPRYSKQRHTLGGIIRLFGTEQQLNALKQALNQQYTVKDYTVMLDIQTIPHIKDNKANRNLLVSRVRTKGMSALRRSEKRLTAQGIWNDDVRQNMIKKWGEAWLDYPHCHLKSASNGQHFILWVNQRSVARQQAGNFNSYGMSQTATVPDF